MNTMAARVCEIAGNECEAFVPEHIAAGKSFMAETTPRTVRFGRAGPSPAGFRTEMIFVALRHVDDNIRRAKAREGGGGRAVTEDAIRAGCRATMVNPPVAL